MLSGGHTKKPNTFGINEGNYDPYYWISTAAGDAEWRSYKKIIHSVSMMEI